MRQSRFGRALEELWYGGSRLAIALQPLAWLFGLAIRLRRRAYALGWMRARSVAVPVIIVGNISVGGTGKTPFVVWLANRLMVQGRRPAIVSRGYGGRGTRRALLVTAASTVQEVGDEALLLARRTSALVCVCSDRWAAAHAAVAAGADCIVADDGLQHYRLARDLEIAVVDGTRGLGNGRLLPAGPLRENSERLATVDLVLTNRSGSDAEGLGFRLTAIDALRIDEAGRRPLAQFRGTQVRVVAGIGNPARFYRLLESFGIEIVPTAVSDHGQIDLARLRAKGPEPILMTEKDAVKYLHANVADIWYVPVEVEMDPAAEARVMERVGAALSDAG